jgi:16S rRNA (guanine527-N7)-methyltransferase
LSEPLHAALAEICAQLALELSADQSRVLLGYIALLQRWNATYNLTSVRDPAQMLTRHLADCLAVIGPLRRHLGPAFTGCRVLDVGSGGGLPGFVIAALNPELSVTCVDSVGKKAAFVAQAAADLKVPNLRAVHSRVESLQAAPFNVVTARAFGSLAELVAVSRHLLSPEGVWMAMKAKISEAESAGVPLDVQVFHVEQLHVPHLSATRCIVWMNSRPSANPRG